ncbi:hypothetical protein BV22DRAFT_1114339 [Leucogyrophana mollusca]|uniref:Uncharacterized protein n=1 Tax=Leucogyrophana mollusca TaxID=85980 RepID=A0ACB8B7Q7_9AGAM|nr:hypothetical protein BV22DRAFT_1114339 [Leucogyrophana mollusca]
MRWSRGFWTCLQDTMSCARGSVRAVVFATRRKPTSILQNSLLYSCGLSDTRRMEAN